MIVDSKSMEIPKANDDVGSIGADMPYIRFDSSDAALN